MKESLVFEMHLPLPYNQALKVVEDAFKVEGFGFLTHIDVRTTFMQKLNEDFRPFSIIGVCNPSLSHRLLKVEPRMGLVLPCKVTIEAADDRSSIVRIINPQSMVVLNMGDDAEIDQVAGEAEATIRRVVKVLEEM